MELTPLYELLIFIEDRKKATTSDFSHWDAKIIRGILGKMEAMRLIEKDEKNVFFLSKNGQQFLNSILDSIHQPVIHWDGKWRTLAFSIPENQRSKRDKFRREIDGLGLKQFLNTFWITPIDLVSQINQIATKLEISDSIFISETEKIFNKTNEDLLKSWDFDKYRAVYNAFIVEADEIIKSTGPNKYLLKKMIFKYAMILNNQPRLPIELMPKDWPQFRAHLQYKKIKRLLTV